MLVMKEGCVEGITVERSWDVEEGILLYADPCVSVTGRLHNI